MDYQGYDPRALAAIEERIKRLALMENELGVQAEPARPTGRIRQGLDMADAGGPQMPEQVTIDDLRRNYSAMGAGAVDLGGLTTYTARNLIDPMAGTDIAGTLTSAREAAPNMALAGEVLSPINMLAPVAALKGAKAALTVAGRAPKTVGAGAVVGGTIANAQGAGRGEDEENAELRTMRKAYEDANAELTRLRGLAERLSTPPQGKEQVEYVQRLLGSLGEPTKVDGVWKGNTQAAAASAARKLAQKIEAQSGVVAKYGEMISPEYRARQDQIKRAKEAAMPYASRNPEMANALNMAAWWAPALGGAAMKGAANLGSFLPWSKASRIEQGINKVDDALKAGRMGPADMAEANALGALSKAPTRTGGRLGAFADEVGANAPGIVLGAGLGAEIRNIPEFSDLRLPNQVDDQGQDTGANPFRDKAWEHIKDPMSHVPGAVFGAAAGYTGSKIGSALTPRKMPEYERGAAYSRAFTPEFQSELAAGQAAASGRSMNNMDRANAMSRRSLDAQYDLEAEKILRDQQLRAMSDAKVPKANIAPLDYELPNPRPPRKPGQPPAQGGTALDTSQGTGKPGQIPGEATPRNPDRPQRTLSDLTLPPSKLKPGNEREVREAIVDAYRANRNLTDDEIMALVKGRDATRSNVLDYAGKIRTVVEQYGPSIFDDLKGVGKLGVAGVVGVGAASQPADARTLERTYKKQGLDEMDAFVKAHIDSGYEDKDISKRWLARQARRQLATEIMEKLERDEKGRFVSAGQ